MHGIIPFQINKFKAKFNFLLKSQIFFQKYIFKTNKTNNLSEKKLVIYFDKLLSSINCWSQ